MKNHGMWLMDPTKQTNRDSLTKEQLQEIKDQILLSLENKYTFISYNGQLKLKKFLISLLKTKQLIRLITVWL